MKEMEDNLISQLLRRPGRPITGRKKGKISITLEKITLSLVDHFTRSSKARSKSKAIDLIVKEYINNMSLEDMLCFVKEQIEVDPSIDIEDFLRVNMSLAHFSNVEIIEDLSRNQFKFVTIEGEIA